MIKFPDLLKYPVIAVDVETTGLEWYRDDRIFGVAISAGDHDFYYDVRKDRDVIPWLADQIPHCHKIVNQNMKFDVHMLRKEGIHVNCAKAECTMNRAALIDEHRLAYDLDSLGEDYLGLRKVSSIYEELAALFGGSPTRAAQMKNLHKAPESLVAPYAKQDTRLALNLWHWQEGEIARQGLEQIWDLERRLFRHVVANEARGIRINKPLAEETIEKISVVIADLKAQINAIAGFTVNPNPSGSIHRLFKPEQDKEGNWFACDGTPLGTTDAGKASINAKALEHMKHPAAPLILQCRKYLKTRDTFLKGHVLGHEVNGYVHPSIHQTRNDDDGGTGTGRFSYSGPALQQIPARDVKVASLVRPIFLPDQGQKWCYGDLEQHEFRIFAHYASPPNILKGWQEDPYADLHQMVADLTSLPRSAKDAVKLGLVGKGDAKTVNLGMVMGMGSGTMAEQMGMEWEYSSFETRDGQLITFKKGGHDVEKLIADYHKMIPGVDDMKKRASNVARSRGFVRSIFGRHLRFPQKVKGRNGKYFAISTHKAAALIYQSGGADFNKMNFLNCCEYLESECPDNRVLLNVHDELSFSMDPDDRPHKHLLEMKKLIQDRPEVKVPILIDFGGLADNWFNATQTPNVTHGHHWTDNERIIA